MGNVQRSIGIDIGGTNIRLGVFESTNCLSETRFEANFSQTCTDHAPDKAWQIILSTLCDAIAQLHSDYPHVKRVGIGFPGFIDPETSVIESSPNLPGLRNVNLAQDLAQLLKEKGMPLTVTVANDANVAALGEYLLANFTSGRVVYCGLGTGVGGGFVFNGKPYDGQHGCAMEIGHIIVEPNGRQCGCGNHGCLETYASATGVAKTYFALTSKKKTAHEIADLANANDTHAIEAFDLAANALAQALATVVKVLDIKTIILGGGLAGAWPLMQPSFDTRFNADLIPVLRGKVSLQLANGSDLAGMIGAAAL